VLAGNALAWNALARSTGRTQIGTLSPPPAFFESAPAAPPVPSRPFFAAFLTPSFGPLVAALRASITLFAPFFAPALDSPGTLGPLGPLGSRRLLLSLRLPGCAQQLA